jgi:membrane fusion protein (multidrug efflux system)
MIKKGALLVPQRAVTELQGSYQVAVVGPGNKIDIRPVKVAERVGGLWVIDQGLKPGEKVVVEGVQKARAGASVHPIPFAPEASPTSEAKPPSQPGEPPKAEMAPAAPVRVEKR